MKEPPLAIKSHTCVLTQVWGKILFLESTDTPLPTCSHLLPAPAALLEELAKGN